VLVVDLLKHIEVVTGVDDLIEQIRMVVADVTGKGTGSTDDAWERHGLSRCVAFIPARSHRPSDQCPETPPEHLNQV
jgi:hypothetical protein